MPIKLPEIEVHKYNTPTATNRDCPVSLGIMNLTDAEARMVAGFVNQVVMAQRNLNLPQPPAAPDPRGQPPARYEWTSEEARAAAYVAEMEAERMKRIALTGRFPPQSQCRNGHPIDSDTSPCARCEVERLSRSLTSPPKPVDVPKGNRFSGLDIG